MREHACAKGRSTPEGGGGCRLRGGGEERLRGSVRQGGAAASEELDHKIAGAGDEM